MQKQAKLLDVVAYCDSTLSTDFFRDYCINGLQVEGKADIKKVVTGVTSSEALIKAAIEKNADMILVHHGFFWKGDDAAITGVFARKLKYLLSNKVSLVAYHLPLDAHFELGNNITLAKKMNWLVEGDLILDDGTKLGNYGKLSAPMTLTELVSVLKSQLEHDPLLIKADALTNPFKDEVVSKIAWCTGAAESALTDAINKKVDVFITGEVPERVVHRARENGIDIIAAGHHATERYGVQALGERIAEKFEIGHEYIEVPSPI